MGNRASLATCYRCNVPTQLDAPPHHVGNRTPTLMQVNHTSYGMHAVRHTLVSRCTFATTDTTDTTRPTDPPHGQRNLLPFSLVWHLLLASAMPYAHTSKSMWYESCKYRATEGARAFALFP